MCFSARKVPRYIVKSTLLFNFQGLNNGYVTKFMFEYSPYKENDTEWVCIQKNGQCAVSFIIYIIMFENATKSQSSCKSLHLHAIDALMLSWSNTFRDNAFNLDIKCVSGLILLCVKLVIQNFVFIEFHCQYVHNHTWWVSWGDRGEVHQSVTAWIW